MNDISKKILIGLGLMLLVFNGLGQVFDDEELSEEDRISDSIFYATVIDDVYGIIAYEPLNHTTGGDSTREGWKGQLVQGWIEDYYPNDQLLHRGYYTEGHLKIYKNFYPSGQMERNYKSVDDHRSSMEMLYRDGTVKSKVIYKDGSAFKWTDYYKSGEMEYHEEMSKSLDYYTLRRTYFENGQIEDNLELVKPSKRLYISQKYNKKGVLLEEGQVIFSEMMWDYLKIDTWSIYNGSGKLIREEIYVKGKLNKEIPK